MYDRCTQVLILMTFPSSLTFSFVTILSNTDLSFHSPLGICCDYKGSEIRGFHQHRSRGLLRHRAAMHLWAAPNNIPGSPTQLGRAASFFHGEAGLVSSPWQALEGACTLSLSLVAYSSRPLLVTLTAHGWECCRTTGDRQGDIWKFGKFHLFFVQNHDVNEIRPVPAYPQTFCSPVASV